MKKIEDYFDTGVYKPVIETTQLAPLIAAGERFYYICGDFWGIQKFIFDRLQTQNAAKVLRAKSAFVELFTEYVARYVCHVADIDNTHILSLNAGKFELISPVDVDVVSIQQKIDDYFIKTFYGLSGFLLCSIEAMPKDFEEGSNYIAFREKIAEVLEKSKFGKFDLMHRESVLHGEDGPTHENQVCRICDLRKIVKNESCELCSIFKELGKDLASDAKQTKKSSELGLDFDGFVYEFDLNQRIRSYVEKKEGSDEAVDFKALASASCGGEEKGVKSLAILKADVDSMGNFIRNESDVREMFGNFEVFSKGIDSFFSEYVPNLMKENFRHTYTVFGGGDDLFVIGAWDEVLALARKVHDDFENFVRKKLSISFGITLAKPSTPVAYLAEHTEELLEKAKGLDRKDAISLFGETVKWKSYLEARDKLYPKLEALEKDLDLKMAHLYRFMELAELGKAVKAGDPDASVWRSKLNYFFRRNLNVEKSEKAKDLLKCLEKEIKERPAETRMVITEYIYKRRKDHE